MITFDIARGERHFAQILELQAVNHFRNVDYDVQSREGFVFASHTPSILKKMAAVLPQIIALDGEHLAGYCLAMGVDLRGEVPMLAPMFEQFRHCGYMGRPLTERRFFVGGQVCVERGYRGQGLMADLYRELRERTRDAYELCVTEIARRNDVSLRAHLKLGFEEVARYGDGVEEWIVVVWPLGRRG